MTTRTQGLLDTSVFIAAESARSLDTSRLPDESYVSVITLAELHAGVLAAHDTETRSRRLRTLDTMTSIQLLPVDASAARHWATMRVRLAEVGRRANVNDLWIASIALAHALPVVTQDRDYDALSSLGGPSILHV